MPRATRTKNVTQEHQDAATREARPRKARAPKKESVRRSDTRPEGPEQGSNKGSEGPEEGRAFPHLTTMPLQSWGTAWGLCIDVQRLTPGNIRWSPSRDAKVARGRGGATWVQVRSERGDGEGRRGDGEGGPCEDGDSACPCNLRVARR